MFVSVIIPAHNCAPYLADAVASVLSQGPKIGEVIIVDDGSIDATRRIAEGFPSPVRVIARPNGGPAAARNSALREARGEYIAFLDGDDVWLPGKIDAQLAYLRENPKTKFVFGRIAYWHPNDAGEYPAEVVDELDDGEGIDARASGWIYPQLLLDSAVCTITVLMHRGVFDRVGGFDESLRTGEDYDYWIRISREFEMHKLSRCVARYRLHQGGTTRQPQAESNELKVLLRARHRFGRVGPFGHAVDDGALNSRIAKLWFEHGYLHYWHGDPYTAANAFRTAFAHERDLKALGYWMLAELRGYTRGATRSGKEGMS